MNTRDNQKLNDLCKFVLEMRILTVEFNNIKCVPKRPMWGTQSHGNNKYFHHLRTKCQYSLFGANLHFKTQTCNHCTVYITWLFFIKYNVI
jgi:hypothetical protein